MIDLKMKKIKKENIITYWDNFNLNLYTRILNLKNIRKMAKKVDLNGHRQVKDSVYENTRARQTAKIRAIAVIREMENMAEDTPNDYELGKRVRTLLKEWRGK